MAELYKKPIFDCVHGFIHLTKTEDKIVNSLYFQRLRWIKQLGWSHYIFPGATHTRFAHALGVLFVMDKIVRSLDRGVDDDKLFNLHVRDQSTMFHRKMRLAAMLHDVGKVGIPDAILKKPGGLTDDEFDVIKTHPVIGARLFVDPNSELDTISRDIALCHHERWDGSERGYPGYVDIDSGKPLPGYTQPNGKAQKRAAEAIPIWARIVSIADVYDALSCRRSYKEPWTQDQVFEELQKSSGSQFDPELVDIFVAMREEMQAIRARYPDLHSE